MSATELPAYALVSRTTLAQPREGGGFKSPTLTEVIAVDLNSRPLVEHAENAERAQHEGADVHFEWYPTGGPDSPEELYVTVDDGEETATGYLLIRATVRLDALGGAR